MKACATEKIVTPDEPVLVSQDEPKAPANAQTTGQSGDTFKKQEDVFVPDYSLIDTKGANTAIEATDLCSFDSNPLL